MILFIPDLDLDFLLIPDPVVRRALEPGSGSATLLRSYQIVKVLPVPTAHSSTMMKPCSYNLITCTRLDYKLVGISSKCM
jgi:hypothetical protein